MTVRLLASGVFAMLFIFAAGVSGLLCLYRKLDSTIMVKSA
jgi:hypothetical protein